MADRFPSMDMAEANAQCGPRPRQQIRDKCPNCEGAVMLHCPDCKIQVTGCLCTEVDRFGQNEAVQRAMERYGEEEAERRLKAAGFWIPPERDN